MLSIGIDVGATGAIAAVDHDRNFVCVHDIPILQRGTYKFVDGLAMLTLLSDIREGRPAHVTAEYAAGYGNRVGVQAVASLGRSIGGIVAVVMIAGLPLELVTPQKWKTHLNLIGRGLTDQQRKERSVSLAKMKFPGANDYLERKKDHNRAEAILLAEYGRLVAKHGGAS